MRFFKNIFVHFNFYLYLGGVAVILASGYFWPALFWVGKFSLLVLLVLTIVDALMLFTIPKLKGSRKVNSQLSLGDENEVVLNVTYQGIPGFTLKVIENPPYQLQMRNVTFKTLLLKSGNYQFDYNIRPEERGAFVFGKWSAFLSGPLHILERRFVFNDVSTTAVYPSVIQLKRLELKTFKRTATQQGVKKIRRLGHNNEFEQIRNYVQGDDYRIINWKASSRRHELMVNQYQDEKAQKIYSIIDKSRSMRNPFEGLTLLDHTINSVLALSNVFIRKGDKSGLMTFSDKMGVHLKAERSMGQLKRINEALYRQKTHFMEADFELLYQSTRQQIKGRSILMLYTNFESETTLKRVLPILRMIGQKHLLVVILFENTEIEKAAQNTAENVKDIYFKSIAEKYIMEKKQLVYELRKYGIQTVLTHPNRLSVDALNKYLELKSKGMG